MEGSDFKLLVVRMLIFSCYNPVSKSKSKSILVSSKPLKIQE